MFEWNFVELSEKCATGKMPNSSIGHMRSRAVELAILVATLFIMQIEFDEKSTILAGI